MKLLLNKRIAIYGAGAVGTYYGLQLFKSGFNPVFICRNKQHEAIKERGLFVEKVGEYTQHYNIPVTDKLDGKFDIIFLAVKSKDTYNSTLQIKEHLKNQGYIVSLQNGIENPEIISSIIGKSKVISTAIYITANLANYGHLRYFSEGKIIFGEYDISGKAYAKELESIFNKTNLNYLYSENIKDAQWRKLMFNVSFNPLSALLRANMGELLSDENLLKLIHNIFLEAKMAAKFSGVILEDGFFEKLINDSKKHPNFKTSMLQDIEANKTPELDGILGPVIRILEKFETKAPYLETILEIMNYKYKNWFHNFPNLAADVLVVDGDNVLLIDRLNKPYGWAIPGGFVDNGESVEKAALRELEEETGITLSEKEIELFGVYSDPQRDPRGHTVSIIYLHQGRKKYKAGDDAKSCKYFHLNSLPKNIAFDHAIILKDYKTKFR